MSVRAPLIKSIMLLRELKGADARRKVKLIGLFRGALGNLKIQNLKSS